jgi:alkyldihydroxyacetonephosphate synthase
MTRLASPPPLRWWGWGDRVTHVPPGLLRLLRDETGITGERVSRVVPIESVALPDLALSTDQLRQLVDISGGGNVRLDRVERVRHSAGRSYVDLLRLRAGKPASAPDAVVHPRSADEVSSALRVCAEAGIAVVPFGGGTSVVGGVTPERGPYAAVIALDVDRLNAVNDVDRESQTATLQAGMRGPVAELHLRARGLSLGHFPQSFEYATIGGFAATRSAGQASTGYGRFDKMARGLAMVTPGSRIDVRPYPSTAAGPSLLQLVLGSEGTIGVITDVTVAVHAAPRVRHYGAWSFADFPSGVAALRELAQRRRAPDVARLSDEQETRVSLAMAGGVASRAARGYLAMRGHQRGCLAILGWEGDGASVDARVRLCTSSLRNHGAVALGSAPGKAWLRKRFEGPYLRDELMDRAVLVETLETAAVWSRVLTVRNRIVAALDGALTTSSSRPIVGCHVSHLYPDGASLYFTVLGAQQSGREVEQWIAAKQAATDVLLDAGGTLTHHHAVGTDHTPWLHREIGAEGDALLRAMKKELDPAGIMNPGKLIPE